MNKAFFNLPQEKQQKIINAALEVFAKSSYKRASTDDMAARAGISKGLLFYYFHNKKALYLFLFQYTAEQMERCIVAQAVPMSTDFFELMEQGAKVKLAIIEKSPAIMDFFLSAYCDKESEAAGELNNYIFQKIETVYATYFAQVDKTKFREGIDPIVILQMLTWMADGYIHEKRQKNLPICTQEIMSEFYKWTAYFKKMAYNEARLPREGESECVS